MQRVDEREENTTSPEQTTTSANHSPTIEYFIAVLHDDTDLTRYRDAALSYIATKKSSLNDTAADKYFHALEANQGYSGAHHHSFSLCPVEHHFLQQYHDSAIAEAEDILHIKHRETMHDNSSKSLDSAFQRASSTISLGTNAASFWSNHAGKIGAVALGVGIVSYVAYSMRT